MLPFEIPELPTDPPVKGFPGVWKLFSFMTPSPGRVSVPNSFVSLFIFFILSLFFILSYLLSKTMGCLSVCLVSSASRSCFVEFAQCSNDLSINLWGKKWSPHPIPLPC